MDFSSFPHFIQILIPLLQEHWAIVVFLGVFLTGENMILAAFVLAAGNPSAFASVFPIALGATLSADLFWYGVARYSLNHPKLKARLEKNKDEESVSYVLRLADRNPFTALLIIKFLVGLRLILLLFLVIRHRYSLRTFLIFNTAGILIFISVLAGIGWLLGNGFNSALSLYHGFVSVILGLLILSLLSHFLPYLLQRLAKRRDQQK